MTAVGYSPQDELYTAACDCGERRYFLTWTDTLAWRDRHQHAAAT